MIKIENNINKIEADHWNAFDSLNPFMKYNFLKFFNNSQKHVKHWYILSKNIRIYANSFSFDFSKFLNYGGVTLYNILFRFFSLKVLYFNNSFLTNISFFHSSLSTVSFENILRKINRHINFHIIVIPEPLFKKLDLNKPVFRIEIESDMILKINKKWNNIEDYKSNLKTKYRKKINIIEKKSNTISIYTIPSNEYCKYSSDIQKLFNNIFTNTSFSGPLFNTIIFKEMIKSNQLKLDGYFLNNVLVAFSTEMHLNNDMYSYFVGFDKVLNKSYSLYARILLEQISRAILLKRNNLILGRTANEFKSNFGAVARKSYVWIHIPNIILNKFLYPFLCNIKLKTWKQRSPFKNLV